MKIRVLLPLHLLFVIAQGYTLVREYSGTGFFDGFDFYGNYDNLTNGDVNWLNKSSAYSENLVGVNGAHHAIIKVDNSTNVPFNFKRDSVRVTTTDSYQLGTLWVIDLLHIPYGPLYLFVFSLVSYFDNTGENWPVGGEIDIIEGVNLMTQNQMALHTLPGCFQTSPPNQPGKSGPSTDCSQGAGCTVLDTTNKSSFGQAFSQAGGGVYATQFDAAGVFIWFWNRADLPPSLQAGVPASPLDVSTWGTPVASYPSTSCNMSQFFAPQELVIDITLCGDWAGLPQVYPTTCSGQAPNNPSPPNPPRASPTCYPDNVPGPGSPRFDEAYFEISYVRAYTTGAPSSTTSPSLTSAVSGAQSTTINANGVSTTLAPNDEIPNSTPTNNRALRHGVGSMTWAVAGMVAVVGLMVGSLVL